MAGSLPYQLLADTVLVVHTAIVVFVVVGLVLIVVGNLRRWTWVNRPWFRVAHLGSIGIVVAESWLGVTCPLTTLEVWLRERAGATPYSGGFIEHWFQRILYYEAPDWVFVLAYTLFGLLVAAAWWRFPPTFRRRSADRSTGTESDEGRVAGLSSKSSAAPVPWFPAAGVFTGLLWLALTVVSRQPQPPSVWLLLVVLLVNSAVWLGLGIAVRRGYLVPGLSCWVAALAFRLCGLFAEPVLEDDHHRFLWDGYVFARTGDPYATAPSDWFGREDVPAQFGLILDRVNHPEVPTIYGPVCQYAFLAAHWISPGQLWPWKLLLLLADVGLLLILLRWFGAGAAWLYAWSPLVVFETAFNAHPELLAVVLACAALRRSFQTGHRSALCLMGFAVAAKVTALLLVPFVMWRAGWRRAVWLPLFLGMCYLPFWVQGSTGDLAGLRAFAAEWEFNSSLYALIQLALQPGPARSFSLLLTVAAATALFVRWARAGGETLPRGDLLFGAMLLCSPVVNPWYLLWLLPFVCARPSGTGLAALVLVPLSYCHAVNLSPGSAVGFDHPTWVRWTEYGGLALVFLVEVTIPWIRRTRAPVVS